MNAITPLLPVLQTLEPLGLPAASLQGWYTSANQNRAARLAQHLESEFREIHSAFAHRVDHAYLSSDAFQANVVQAIRAAEMAESESKLRFIARALAGCSLSFPAPSLDKFQTLRIIEGMSDRELKVFMGLFDLLDPIDPYADTFPVESAVTVAGLTRQEFAAALLGLGQLGLLIREAVAVQPDPWNTQAAPAQAWKLTALARQVATLSRVNSEEL